MIIVKTKNGDNFINDKAVTAVYHDKENKRVSYTDLNGESFLAFDDVEAIFYTNDAMPTKWEDEGSAVERQRILLDISKKRYEMIQEEYFYWQKLCRKYKEVLESFSDEKHKEWLDDMKTFEKETTAEMENTLAKLKKELQILEEKL